MRIALPFLLAALTGCQEPPKSTSAPPNDPITQAALDGDYPRVIRASPEITNYTLPNWPLEPGDTVTGVQWRKLDLRYGSKWGMGVVWVVGQSGAVLPFVAGFDYGWTNTYVGHLPARLDHYGSGGGRGHWAPELESELPASLRGVVDVRDHIPSLAEWQDFRNLVKSTPGGLREILEKERNKYYGPGASW